MNSRMTQRLLHAEKGRRSSSKSPRLTPAPEDVKPDVVKVELRDSPGKEEERKRKSSLDGEGDAKRSRLGEAIDSAVPGGQSNADGRAEEGPASDGPRSADEEVQDVGQASATG